GTGDGRNFNIWTIQQDGTGAQQISHGTLDEFPTCSPDGKWLFYIDGDARKLMKVPISGGTAQSVGSAPSDTTGGLDLSKDGKTVLLGTYDFKLRKPDISLVDADSGRVLRILQYDPRHVGRLCLSPDGKGVVYSIYEKGAGNLWLQPLDGGPGRQITHFTSLRIYSYAWSADGKRLALVRGDDPSDLVLVRENKN
ncbi:MAG: TolB family protein, partial [Terriglobales bacterium]